MRLVPAFIGLLLLGALAFALLLFSTTREAAALREVRAKTLDIETYAEMAYQCRKKFPLADAFEVHRCATGEGE